MVDLSDYDETKAWLEAQTRSVRVAFAARCALRAVPGIAVNTDATLRGLALPSLRATITSGAAMTEAAPEVIEAARSAARSAAAAAFAAARSAAREDGAWLDGAKDGTPFFATPLWPNGELPEGLAAALDTLRAFWDSDPETWGFWRRWYDGMLAGEPLPWELQEQVALLPDDIWEAGAEAVAREIETIEARFELEARIAELERDIAALKVDRHGIGGNMPPEPIEEPLLAAEIRRLGAQLEPVEEALVVLKEEAARDEPDKARLSSAVATIAAALTAILRWTGSKLDLAIDTLIKWGIPTGCAYLLANPQRLQAVLDAAKRLLNLL